MTTLHDLASSFGAVIAAADVAFSEDARAGVPASDADLMKERAAKLLVMAWLNAAEEYRAAQDGREPDPRQQPPEPAGQAALPLPTTVAQATFATPTAAAPAAAPGPLADTLAKIAAGLHRAPEPAPAPAVVVPPGVGGSFDEWVALADALGRNVQDVLRQWHSSRDGIEGGWDKATDQQRAEQYGKALSYYQNKAAEPGEIDPLICFKCGTKAEEHRTRNNEPFFKCPNTRCGFNGTNGWVSTMWDTSNYSEKRQKWQEGRQRAQQRGGRSYAGRR